MIRKLKNILNKENVGSDMHSMDMQPHSDIADPVNSSPVNFIKRSKTFLFTFGKWY